MKWVAGTPQDTDDVAGMFSVPSDDHAEGLPPDLAGLRDWSLAIRYHDFKGQVKSQRLRQELRGEVVAAVLMRAREVLGPLARPARVKQEPFSRARPESVTDLDLDATLDEAASLRELDPWVETRTPEPQPLVICIDTSLSMTGEKLALAAVALGVVALQFPDEPFVLIAFESEPAVLKRLDEVLSLEELLARFMDVPAQGYTDLEAALKEAATASRQVGEASGRRPVCVLVSDGKYTAGRDPGYLGSAFSHLEVIKMGEDDGGRELCAELARRGRGRVRGVGDLAELPRVMYEVIKNLRIPVGR